MQIQNFFFDLDDTLFDFHAAEHRAVSLTLTHFGIAPTEEMCALYSKLNLEQWKRLEKGEITRTEVKINRFARFFEQTGLAVKLELIQSLYGRYRLYIVTNGTARVQQGRIADAGIEKYFDGIFISELIGADKPSKAFFEACFEKIPDFHKEKTVLVGDSLSSDIRGGKNAGLFTVWYNPRHEALNGQITPDEVIYDLSEIETKFCR